MRIDIFSDAFPPQVSGVANVVNNSAKELAKLGHKVRVFTVSSKMSSGRKVCQKDGFSLVETPSFPALVYSKARLSLPIGLTLSYLKHDRPDIIHTHTPFAIGWEAIEAAKIYKLPIIGTHHTFFNHYLKHAHLDNRMGERLAWKYTVNYYNRCDMVISPSQSLAKELVLYGLKKPIAVLPNAIDTNLFKPCQNAQTKNKLREKYGISGFCLGYMGRLSYEKSVGQVLQAAAEAKKHLPDLHLIIIGDGPEKAKLKRLARHLKMDSYITFTGFLYGQELVNALQTLDLFITASKTENMPLAVLETMACGLPGIAVDTLGLPEMIDDQVNGYLVKPDNIAQMAEQIEHLAKQSKLLSTFGENSRKMALEYSLPRNALSLENIYKQIIDQKKSAK